MKGLVLSVLIALATFGFWGCEIIVGPPHGKVIIAPAPHPDDSSSDDHSGDEGSSDDAMHY